VEAILEEHPGVLQCAVVSRDDVPGGRLVAFVVPAERPPAAEELNEHLRSRLPDYMQPSAIVIECSLPLTPSGKVNRRLLEVPAPMRMAPRGFVPPAGDVEQKLAAIWAEVLHIDCVGAEDDFFELGGHSLLATQVVSRIRQAFEIHFPLRLVFEQRTLRQLAAEVQDGVLRAVMELPEAEAQRLVNEEN
jgi:acyl carrier protein